MNVSIVKQMFFVKIYQMVENWKVSESARLAGKTLIQYLGVFNTFKYLKISILGQHIETNQTKQNNKNKINSNKLYVEVLIGAKYS